MTVSLKMKSLRKIPKLVLIMCILLTILPSFLTSLNLFYIDDMLWFLLLFPCFVFSYYLGFRGGLYASVIVNAYHLLWFIYEKYLRISEFVNQEISLHTGVAVVTFFCAIGVGILSEKLKEKQIQLQNLNNKLEQLAMYDSLTNLPNRHYYIENLSKSLREGKPVFLLFLDLDGFKKVNDIYGHEEGDNILKEVAERLMLFRNEFTFISRIGGDEFTIMLTGVDKEQSIEIASEMIKILQIEVNGLEVSASIGIAESKHGDTPSSILKRADKAMYNVKSTGKNAVGYDESDSKIVES